PGDGAARAGRRGGGGGVGDAARGPVRREVAGRDPWRPVYSCARGLALRRPLSHRAGAPVQTKNLIAGQWVGADSGKTFHVTNPATDEVIARVPDVGAAETRRAIDAADGAFAGWAGLAAPERAA